MSRGFRKEFQSISKYFQFSRFRICQGEMERFLKNIFLDIQQKDCLLGYLADGGGGLTTHLHLPLFQNLFQTIFPNVFLSPPFFKKFFRKFFPHMKNFFRKTVPKDSKVYRVPPLPKEYDEHFQRNMINTSKGIYAGIRIGKVS